VSKEINMKTQWIDGMYTTTQIADFMGVSQGTVGKWVQKGGLVPTAVVDGAGAKHNPILIKMGAGGARGLKYLFSKENTKMFLRGRWIAGQSWGDGRRRQPGDELPQVLRI